MKATIWHNPKCGTSRKTLEILDETPGVDVTVIEYLNTPPTRDQLTALYARAGISVRDGLRAKEEDAKALIAANASEDQILDAMMANPVLIERPLVATDKGVRLCRPQEKVSEIL
jgi:arsenate reductase